MNTQPYTGFQSHSAQRELNKEELEAQIRHKEQRLGTDIRAATGSLGAWRSRAGFHLRVTLPLSLTVLAGVATVVSRVAVRRARAQLMNDPGLKLPAVAIVRALGRIKPGALAYGGLLFGVGALLGARRRRPRQTADEWARQGPEPRHWPEPSLGSYSGPLPGPQG
jgi:hypothetical protein